MDSLKNKPLTPLTNAEDANKKKGSKQMLGDEVEEEGDFSQYLLLKEKFDEIQVFITRIASLLAKAVQASRGRHASPQLKREYVLNQDGPLKEWLAASPSKAQVDRDSRRFYLKFKKRFETGKAWELTIRSLEKHDFGLAKKLCFFHHREVSDFARGIRLVLLPIGRNS